MAKVTSVTQCRTEADFERAVKRQGGQVVNGGTHPCAKVGGTRVPLGSGNPHKELPTGTRKSIISSLLKLGLVVALFGCLALAVLAWGSPYL